MKQLLPLCFFAFAHCATAQNVGIGNADPKVPLSFASTLGNKISLYGSTTTNVYGLGVQGGALQLFSDNASSNIVFGHGSSTAFTERMRIMGTGNVGIGTNAPAYILDVNSRMRIRHNGANTAGIWLNKPDNTEGSFIGTVNDSTLGFWGPSGQGSYKAVIDVKNGAVGIGTLEPKIPLSFASTTGNKISLFGSNTTNVYGLGVQGGLLQVFSDNAASDIGFGYGSSTAFTEKMRITGTGNVGIGITTPAASLQVARGTGIGGSAQFDGTQYSSHFNYNIDEQTIIRGGKANSPVKINDLGTGNVSIAESGGNVGIRKGNPTATLDVARGTGEDGTARFTGTQYASHFNYFTDEQTFIRGGKSTSEVIINDLGTGNVRIAQAGGNVGIGTGTPPYKLTVRKTGIGISQENETGTASVGFVATSTSGWLQTHTATPLYLGAGNPASPDMKIELNGNVGIGTVGVPTERLEVAGQIKITGGSPGVNKVLTSDAAGKGTWQATTSANSGFHASAAGYVFSNSELLVPFADNNSTQDFDDGPGVSFFNLYAAFYAPAAGVYNFNFAVYCGHAFIGGAPTSNGGYITVTLRKNDVVIKTIRNTLAPGSLLSQGITTINGSATVKLLFNDYITVYVENGTDIGKDIFSGDGAQTYFTGHRLY